VGQNLLERITVTIIYLFIPNDLYIPNGLCQGGRYEMAGKQILSSFIFDNFENSISKVVN
jgi:hypothetical protein